MKNDMKMISLMVCMLAILPLASRGADTNAPIQKVKELAEEGCVRDALHSCDPFGLPRESQETRFVAGTSRYLAQQPDAKFALGVETPVRKIFRDKYWFQGAYTNQISLSAARNEFEAFQLCVIPLGISSAEPLKGVSLKASDLISADTGKIPAEEIKIWQEGYVKTRKPSYPTPHVGYWPDPLLEIDGPATIAGHQLQPFWVRLHIASDVKPGWYRGSIVVSTQQHGSQTLNISLRVRNFTLPEDPKIIFHSLAYLRLNNLMNYYGIDKAAAEKMADHYADVLIRDYKYFPATTTAMLSKEDEDYSNYDARMQQRFDEGMQMCWGIPGVAFKGLSGGTSHEEFKRLTDHLREKGWLDKVFIYALRDEPSEAQYPKLREYASKLRELVPDVKILTAESPHPGLAGYTDAWWSDVSTEIPAYNRERQQAGDLVLWYFCRIPIHMDQVYQSIWDSPLMMIDRAAAEQRVAFWLAWKYQIDGIMIWAGNGSWYKKGKTTWPNEDWDPYLDVYKWPYGGADNGNGVMFYPGKTGPLPSLRLEVLREGREDYEYLWLLKHLAGDHPSDEVKQALAIDPHVCITPHNFTKDPQAFYRQREHLAELIEALQP